MHSTFLDLHPLHLFFVFLISFILITFLVYSRRTAKVIQLRAFTKELKKKGANLTTADDKKTNINAFLDALKKRNDAGSKVSVRIIKEWLQLQKSLSNFQKYDFELHIDSYLRSLKINYSDFARNMLLLGLLFTFLGLSFAFAAIGVNNDDLSAQLSEQIIPSISLAFTSTIAALFISLAVIISGRSINGIVSDYQTEISRFLIIHVHPYYEKAGQEVYFSRLESLFGNMEQALVEVNQNLQIVSTQSVKTLENLTEGVERFSYSFAKYGQVLSQTEEILKKSSQSQLSVETSVANLSQVVNGMVSVFESEELVLKEVVESSREQTESIKNIMNGFKILEKSQSHRITSVLESLKETETSQKRSLESMTEKLEESDRAVELAFNKSILLLSEKLTTELNLLTQKLQELPADINNSFVRIYESSVGNAKDLNLQINSLTESFEKSITDAAQTLNITSATLSEFSKVLHSDMSDAASIMKESQKTASEISKVVAEKYEKALNKIETSHIERADSFEQFVKHNISTQKDLIEKLNRLITNEVGSLGKAVSNRESIFIEQANAIVKLQKELQNELKKSIRNSNGRNWSWPFSRKG